jgi:hypothetical protein
MNEQFTLRTIVIMITLLTTVGACLIQQAEGIRGAEGARIAEAAPVATSGDNVYIAWSTNKTGNNEVMFRASTDNGATFGNKINLSNSTVNSERAEIGASGDRVFVTWWERNATSNMPVLKISNDNGKTFGPLLNLSTNGTIGSSGG